MLNITSGKIQRAQKVVIYGAEGIGKTTLAAKFPNPLFIDTEGGSSHLDVRRLEIDDDWNELVHTVREVAASPDVCSTLVLDTADWAEQLCIRDLCKKYKKDSLEDFGYGKGYTYVSEEFMRLLEACDAVIASGINVVVTAHAKMRKFEQPDEMGAYDRWEMKLTRQTAPLIKEWCDMLLFCNYKTYVVNSQSDKQKAQGGKRVMYTNHHPCWDAKNRHDLEDMLEMEYEKIAYIFSKKAAEPKANLKDELKKKLEEAGVTTDELQNLVTAKGHYPETASIEDYNDDFIKRWVFVHWDAIISTIKNNKTKEND